MNPPLVSRRRQPVIACHRISRMTAILLVSLLTLAALPALAQETTATAESTPATPTPLPPPTRPDPSRYRLHPVASGLYRPVYLTHAGDGSDRLFVLEQHGRIRLLVDDVLQPDPWLDLTALVSRDSMRQFSERGLLGLAFHPDFEENGRFFVHYSDHRGDTVLERYSLGPDDPAAPHPCRPPTAKAAHTSLAAGPPSLAARSAASSRAARFHPEYAAFCTRGGSAIRYRGRDGRLQRAPRPRGAS